MIVSTSHLDPMDAFAKLVQQQNLQQSQSPAKLPKWFMTNIYKYFILLHDVTEGEESKYVKNDKEQKINNIVHTENIERQRLFSFQKFNTKVIYA